MSNQKFEIKILKEADGSNANLADLSVSAAKSLAEIIESLSRIAEYENSNGEVRLKVTTGSACVAIEAPAPKLTAIKNSVDKVADYDSEDEVYVENLRKIQQVIQSNGLIYDATITNDDGVINLLDKFKQQRTFRKRRKVTKYAKRFHMEFFTGRLYAVGGKNPNIHIESVGETYPIDCDEAQARVVNKFLYQDVFISTWVKTAPHKKPKYYFCDHYVNENVYQSLRDFVEHNTSLEGTEVLKHIHYRVVDYVNEGDFGNLKKFLRLFTSDIVDIQRQRTVLTVLKSYKDSDDIKSLFDSIAGLIQKQTKKPVL